MINNYQILIKMDNHCSTQYVSTEQDLVDQYKSSIIQGKGVIIWEDGVIDCSNIIAILRQKRVDSGIKENKTI